MCWLTSKREFGQIKTAEEDIPVYKFLNRKGTTPYQDYPISFGITLPKVLIDNDNSSYFCIIEEGYHSYSSSVRITKDFFNTHVYNQSTDRWLASFHHYNACYKAYIPKDTKYCINDRNEIVSETLVVLNEIINPDWEDDFGSVFVFDDHGKLIKKEYHLGATEKPVGVCLDYYKENKKTYFIICSLLDEDWTPSDSQKESHFQKLYGGTICSDTPLSLGNASSLYLIREFLNDSVDWNMPFYVNKSEVIKAFAYSLPPTDNSLCYYLPMIGIEIENEK